MKTLNEIETLENVIKHKESILEYTEQMLKDQFDFLCLNKFEDSEHYLSVEQMKHNIWEIRNFIKNNLYTNGQENF